MKLTEFEERMNAFTFRQHQDFMAYLSTLERKGYTLVDAKQYIVEKRKQLAELEEAARERDRIFPMCPECGEARLVLRPVTTKQGPANVHGWRSCLECPNCAYEKYDTKTPEQVIIALAKEYEDAGLNTKKRQKDREERMRENGGQDHGIQKL